MCSYKISTIDHGLMNSSIDNIGLTPDVVLSLKKANIDTPKKIITIMPIELVHLTNLSWDQVMNVVKVASQAVNCDSTLLSVVSLLGTSSTCLVKSKLSTGCPVINDLFKGGLPLRGITEIYGSSASGKTQLCLQLSLMVQFPQSLGGMDGKALYICTEDTFPSKRLDEIITNVKMKHSTLKNLTFMDNILISQIGNAENLMSCVCSKIEHVIKRMNVRLLVLDSVAATFRSDYDVDQNSKRSRDIQSLGYSLHNLAEKFNLVVVCVNQVMDNVENNTPWCRREDGIAVPALGLVWSNLVTNRIQLSRSAHTVKRYQSEKTGLMTELHIPAVVCTMKVIHSPYLPISKVKYIINASGVEGIKM